MIKDFYIDSLISFFNNISDLSNFNKGIQFELLTVSVLKKHPIYASILEQVWLLRKGLPSNIRKKLNIPQADEGIDIIAQTYSGEFWAIQCKFKASKEPPTMRELSTFNNLAHTHCKNISMAILFHTGERGVRKKHLMGEKYAEVGLEFWLGLSPEDWIRINDSSTSNKAKPIVRMPREHQKKAIKSAQDHYLKQNASRGRLIMPCGTGKSLTAFWIANSLNANSIIVAVPSLSLIKQSLEDWTSEFVALDENPKPLWRVICTDDTTTKLNDEFVSEAYSLGFPNTDIDDIASFLKINTKGKKVIFTTYQSSDKLAQAARKANISFDLAILDEAHKTVGIKSKAFATLLSDKNISIKKRMFMTATERVLKGTNDDVLSMDDESVYGKRFFQLTFKDAIHSSPQIISDYKILTIAVTNAQIQEMIQKNNLLTDKKNSIEEQDGQSLAAAIALRQATKKYGIKHAISFHRSIKSAESFTNLNVRLNSSKVDKINLTSYHISSKKSAGQRSQLLDDFRADKLALMTNARCLTEGVNVPTIDCVLFADPKQSIVDIVQAAGRALRVSPGKKYGYIMMPLIVPDNMELVEFTETTPFRQVARIVTGLSTQDERIVEEFRLLSDGKKIADRRVEISGNIPVGLKLDISSFASSIEAKYWEKVGRANWRSYAEAQKQISSIGFKNVSEWRKFSNSGSRPFDIPSRPNENYKNCGWTTWGAFLGNETIATKDIVYLSFKEAREYIRSKKFKTRTDFSKFLISEERPSYIHSHPEIRYNDSGWKGWSDFLGVSIIGNSKKQSYSFALAKKLLKKLKVSSKNKYYELRASGVLNKQFPSNPPRTFEDSGWISWGDYLGTNPGQIPYLGFKEARSFARQQGLKSNKEWALLILKLKRNDLPRSPDDVYKSKGWKGWPDFLGKK
jgi:superfamily II DNA or RNA helicase